MVYWIGMFISNLLIPLVMLVCGWLFVKHPPKQINWIYGYRTKMSTKNQETWDFAHAYCGKLWIKIGWMMALAVSLVMIGILLSGNHGEAIISQMHTKESLITTSTVIIEILEVIIMVGSIIPVEKALKKQFDKDGHKK